ncbi:Clp protease ClpP [Salmonella enterica subsp. enterica serovar Virchow]|nr:Clp protease ClpP [Salmonella enterica subsp. enterica serovar Virchow]
MTKALRSRVFAKARPGALPVPANRDVCALTRPQVLDKWSEDAAGVRAVEMGDNIITMFDMIGEDFWSGGGVTAKKVSAQLRAIGPKPIEVQINSPGGDMFEGIAIYNVLREHPQPITVKIMGMAASAASVIAMAGDEIHIGAASFIMIHNCWVCACGNRHDMADVSEWLAPFDQAMVDVYAARTGQSAEEIAKWMDDETFMSGSTCMERGFADALLSSDKMKVEEETKASDRKVNELRAMELALMAQGHSRTDARARVNKIRGTTDSAPDTVSTTDSAGTKLTGALAGLLSTLQR